LLLSNNLINEGLECGEKDGHSLVVSQGILARALKVSAQFLLKSVAEQDVKFLSVKIDLVLQILLLIILDLHESVELSQEHRDVWDDITGSVLRTSNKICDLCDQGVAEIFTRLQDDLAGVQDQLNHLLVDLFGIK